MELEDKEKDIMSKEDIIELLNNDGQLIGALLALYARQTIDEQQSKGTSYQNAIGFNAFDAPILSNVVSFYKDRGYLTTKQINMVRLKMKKYAGQLSEMEFEPVILKGVTKQTNSKRTRAPFKYANWKNSTTFRVDFSYDPQIVEMIKSLASRKGHKVNGKWHWTAGMTVSNIAKLIEYDFTIDSKLKKWYEKQTGGLLDYIDIPGMKLDLYPYQFQALSFVDSRNGRALIADDMGLGKSQKLDTKILTPNGWIKMGKIKVGDFVIGQDGYPTEVIGVYPQGIKPSYRVDFTDNTSTNCCHEHLWAVKDTNRRYRKQDWTVKSAQELMDSGLQYPNRANKYNIPIVEPVHFPKKDLPIHPYIMGILIAEGGLTQNSVVYSNPDFDSDISDKIRKILPKEYELNKYHKTDETNCSRYGISYILKYSKNPIKKALRDFGLLVTSPNRFIPEIYQFGSVRQRFELLCGLMDGDGSTIYDQNNPRKRTRYCTTSEQLAKDVVELVQLLGGIAICNNSSYKHGIRYDISISLTINPFSCKRKTEAWRPIYRKKYIKSITYIEDVEQQCIKVKNEDGLYVCESGIITHNTPTAAGWMQMHYKTVLPAVIICPASVKQHWVNQIDKFTSLGGVVEILSGKKPHTVDLTSQIFVINYDILGAENKDTKEVKSWLDYIMKVIQPYTLIADESHLCKNFKTQRTKAALRLAKYCDHVLCLTGTPIKNRPSEIFSSLRMINNKLFPSFKRFADKFCNPTHNGYGWNYNGASNTIELNQILTREIMIRRKKSEVLKDLPAKTRTIIPLPLTNRPEYERARDNLIKYLKGFDKQKAEKAKRAEILVKMETLKQLAAYGKLEESVRWIEEMAGQEKMVIFCTHKNIVDTLMEKFGEQAIKIDGRVPVKKRQGIVDKFVEDNNLRIFIGNIQAAGTGIDGLQYACSNVVYLEYPWTSGDLIQSEDRVNRNGQKLPVTCWNIVAEDSIEVDIVELLEEKSKILNQVLDGEDTDTEGIFGQLLGRL